MSTMDGARTIVVLGGGIAGAPCSQTFPAKIEFLLKPLQCRTATADRDGSLAHASGVQD